MTKSVDFLRNPQSSYPTVSPQDSSSALETVEEEQPRDPRDVVTNGYLTLATTERSASPYTRSPAVDFDGLSWPSKRIVDLRKRPLANTCRRPRYS